MQQLHVVTLCSLPPGSRKLGERSGPGRGRRRPKLPKEGNGERSRDFLRPREMKPLRPFPLPLGVGTDICRISRIHAILGSARARRFIDRVLTPEERARAEPRLRLRPEKQVAADHAAGDAAPARRVLGHEEMARRDPVLWATASFVAGR